MKLDGKVALVTGGNSGIGLGTARTLVANGAHVYITGRRQPELDRAVAEIGAKVTAIRGDIAEAADLDAVFSRIKAEKGGLDILVANAGVVEIVPLSQATPDHFDRIFDINARGTFLTVLKAVALMRDGGSIVLVSSSGHVKGISHYGVYLAAKAAVRSMGRSWADELKGRNIRVNTLSPGPVDTPIFELQGGSKQGADALRQQFSQMIPLGRMGQIDDVAKAALYLASDDSSFVTGTDLFVDGGMAQL